MLTENNIIIIAEDDDNMIQLYKQYFAFKKETKKAKMLYARNIKECVEMLESEKPTLMLLDLGLEDQYPPPGFKILRDYKDKLKIIVISGYHEHEQQSLDEGAIKFFKKPIEPKELVTALIENA